MNWGAKLYIECIEEENDELTIQIEWDENDPDLAMWTDWGLEKQKEFMKTAIQNACQEALKEDLTDLMS